MKVKVLEIKNSISKRKIGEIIEAKRLCELTEEELETSIGKVDLNDTLWEINDIFIHDIDNHWLYVADDEVEVVEE